MTRPSKMNARRLAPPKEQRAGKARQRVPAGGPLLAPIRVHGSADGAAWAGFGTDAFTTAEQRRERALARWAIATRALGVVPLEVVAVAIDEWRAIWWREAERVNGPRPKEQLS